MLRSGFYGNCWFDSLVAHSTRSCLQSNQIAQTIITNGGWQIGETACRQHKLPANLSLIDGRMERITLCVVALRQSFRLMIGEKKMLVIVNLTETDDRSNRNAVDFHKNWKRMKQNQNAVLYKCSDGNMRCYQKRENIPTKKCAPIIKFRWK